MHAHATRESDRTMPKGRREAALVERMAGLVDDGHETAQEVGLVPAGRDPHVFGHPAAERVVARVESAMREVEAQVAHDPFGEPVLGVRRKRARQNRHFTLRPLLVDDRRREPGQEGRQLREQPVDLGRRAAGLVFVEQRVVGGDAEGLRLRLCDLAGEPEHLAQGREHARKVVAVASSAPVHLAGRDGPRVAHDEVARQRHRVAALALHLAQVRELPCVGAVAGRLSARAGEPVADLLRHQEFMRDLAQRRHLLAAHGSTPRRHDRRHVPLQDADRLADEGDPAEAGLERRTGRRADATVGTRTGAPCAPGRTGHGTGSRRPCAAAPPAHGCTARSRRADLPAWPRATNGRLMGDGPVRSPSRLDRAIWSMVQAPR